MTKLISFWLFAAVILALPAEVQAKRVEPDRAEKVAQRFAELKHGPRAKVKHKQRHKHRETVNYYVFSINEDTNGGFVIVAGDDAVRPVLGYSYNGNYDENNLPANFAYWMGYLQKQIAWAQEQELAQSEAVQQEWDGYAVSPLIQTRWDQGAPYNNMSPVVSGRRSYTGCVATAMSQIMKYHNHPVQGSGRSDAYRTTTHRINIPSVNFSETSYDWENMQDRYPQSTASTPQNNAVATLMYHAGVSVRMDYSPNGSGALSSRVPMALVTYFGYDRSIQHLHRQYYEDAAWEAVLKEQIDAGMPIYYDGYNESEGHAFILDGYDGEGKFHFNWGWSGLYDGYFVTTALNPGTDGAGAGSGVFNEDQTVIINIKPDWGGNSYGYEMSMRNFTTSKTSVIYDENESFTVSFSRLLNVATLDTFPGGQLNVALVDDRDNIVALVASSANIGILPPYNYYTASRTFNCVVPDAVEPGKYKLRVVTRPNGGAWRAVAFGSPNSIDFYIVPRPPTITVHPTDQTIQAGKTAKFEIEATASRVSSITYQWQVSTDGDVSFKNVLDGIGGTSATYTTPKAITAMSGYRYRCIVMDNYSQSDTSGIATLNVVKADPDYTLPTDLIATLGDSLSNIILPEGWSWEETRVVDSVGLQIHKAKFTPKDTENYNIISGIDITVIVDKVPSIEVSIPVRRNISAYTIGNSVVLQDVPNNAKVGVYNLQGKQIYSAEVVNGRLKIPVQTKGMYIIKISLGSKTKMLCLPVM
ncbi:MAG: C10 family peptidase [Fibromonadaceae bacterium]|jgi:hypothetical protein|nr:C10 family peptidase [Fibromonadaceae bacterium]